MMKKHLALLLCITTLFSLLSACNTVPDVMTTTPRESTITPSESELPATEPQVSVSTYEQGIFTEDGYASEWLNLRFQVPSDMVASDISVNDIYNEAQKEAYPDSYTIIEMDTLDREDSSKCPVSLTTQKMMDNQKTVQQLASDAKQAIIDSYDSLSAYNMTAKVQWDPVREMLFLGETYLMYHYYATTYSNGSVRADMEHWKLYRLKEDRLITFTFGDEHGMSRLGDFLELFSALEGNPATAYVEDCATVYDYEYDFEAHTPAIITSPAVTSVVNDNILTDLNPYMYYNGAICNATYNWSVVEDVVSICVCAESLQVSDTNYLVYNVSATTGKLLSKEEFLSHMELSGETYTEQLQDALTAKFYELYEDNFDTSSESFQDCLAWTISEEMMEKARPFYSTENGLCVVANVGSLAGADAYYRVVSLSKNDTSSSEPVPSTSNSGTSEKALQIFWTVGKSNWNGNNMASLTEIVFTSYDVQCSAYQGSSTQYLVTLSGEYCPNVVDLPYVTNTGSITFLIDTATAKATLMEDSGIIEAFEVYIALGTAWYY